ncbi:MAG: molybdate ABC transporter substrate-binding protein [Rhodothermales bacterium]
MGCKDPVRHGVSGQKEILVFGAASLTDALEALADSFETAYPQHRVVLNLAATSLLARQIEQGAPADVFFSANLAWMQHLEEEGHISGRVRQPLGNQLVVVGRPGEKVLPSVEMLADQPRIALADPEHVPAGIYARQGLECAGLWERVMSRVVPMLDVRAALLAVRNGAADVAIVYASDVQADSKVQVLLPWPATCQPEIRYAVARLKNATSPEGADRLLAFAIDTARVSFWEGYGFLPRLDDDPTER